MDANLTSPECSAWNPGLESQLPRAYLPLSTIFRADNVSIVRSEPGNDPTQRKAACITHKYLCGICIVPEETNASTYKCSYEY